MLGALVSILFIWVITVWLMVEATFRFINPMVIDSKIMLIVSGLCLVFNLIQMSILHSKDMHDFAHGPGQSCGHDHSDGHAHDHNDHSHSHDHDHSHHDHGHCANHEHAPSSGLEDEPHSHSHSHTAVCTDIESSRVRVSPEATTSS